MINVNFTSESEDAMYSYSWKNCSKNKNISFEVEGSEDTWCTVTDMSEDSIVKIHADAMPSREREDRDASIVIKVNGTKCKEAFHVTQAGRPCDCNAYKPIKIGEEIDVTIPSAGADPGTVIGTYFDDDTCPSGIEITGDLDAEAVDGEIKLKSGVEPFDDGRTFNVIFNHNDIKCKEGTCVQKSASCRCTEGVTITKPQGDPVTFGNKNTCDNITPKIVLKVDDCCTITTGITGDDKDEFRVNTEVLDGYKLIKVCPIGENTSTTDKKTATISVNATCGNNTCSETVNIEQLTNPCVPTFICSCYDVSQAEVISDDLTCDSTTARIKWYITAYTINKDENCEIKKHQETTYYIETGVTFDPNTGSDEPIEREGVYTWEGYKPCIGNTCGEDDIKIPWKVTLPACEGCTCVPDEAFWGRDESIPNIPVEGIGNEYTVVYKLRINPTFLPETCFDKYSLGNVTVKPEGSQIPSESKINWSTETCTVGGEEKQCTVLTISSKGLEGNQLEVQKNFLYQIKLNDVECFNVKVIQDSVIPCDCTSMDKFLTVFHTMFDQDGSGGAEVLIASGETFCGSLSALSKSTLYGTGGPDEYGELDVSVVETEDSKKTYIKGIIKSGYVFDSAGVTVLLIDNQGQTMFECPNAITIVRKSGCACEYRGSSRIYVSPDDQGYEVLDMFYTYEVISVGNYHSDYKIHLLAETHEFPDNYIFYSSLPIHAQNTMSYDCGLNVAYRLDYDSEYIELTKSFNGEYAQGVINEHWASSLPHIYGSPYSNSQFYALRPKKSLRGVTTVVTVTPYVEVQYDSDGVPKGGYACTPTNFYIDRVDCNCENLTTNDERAIYHIIDLKVDGIPSSSTKVPATGGKYELTFIGYIGDCWTRYEYTCEQLQEMIRLTPIEGTTSDEVWLSFEDCSVYLNVAETSRDKETDLYFIIEFKIGDEWCTMYRGSVTQEAACTCDNVLMPYREKGLCRNNTFGDVNCFNETENIYLDYNACGALYAKVTYVEGGTGSSLFNGIIKNGKRYYLSFNLLNCENCEPAIYSYTAYWVDENGNNIFGPECVITGELTQLPCTNEPISCTCNSLYGTPKIKDGGTSEFTGGTTNQFVCEIDHTQVYEECRNSVSYSAKSSQDNVITGLTISEDYKVYADFTSDSSQFDREWLDVTLNIYYKVGEIVCESKATLIEIKVYKPTS